MAAAGRKQRTNDELMREIGSKKGFDPMPPDQYLTWQDKRYDPAVRFWAWLMAHTIRQGKRSPWAVDDEGKELHIEHAAADLEMDVANLRDVQRRFESEGRMPKREGKRNASTRRLRISGEFQLQAVVDDDEGRTEGEDKGLYRPFAPYVVKQIKKLPPEKRKAFLEGYAREDAAEKRLIAEGTAAVRGIFTPRKDSMFAAFGIKKISDGDETPRKAEKTEREKNQLRLLFANAIAPEVERFVQTFTGSVQTSKNGSVQKKNGPVQNFSSDASLFGSEVQSKARASSRGSEVGSNRKAAAASGEAPPPPDTQTSNPPVPKTANPTPSSESQPPSSLHEPVEEIAIFIGQELKIDHDAATRLAVSTRAKDPQITKEEIVGLANLKRAKAQKQIQSGAIENPTGLLLKHLPEMVHGAEREEVRAELQRLSDIRRRNAPSEPTLEERIEVLQGRIESRQRLANDERRTPAQREEFRQQLLQAKAEKAQLEELLGKQTAKAAGD